VAGVSVYICPNTGTMSSRLNWQGTDSFTAEQPSLYYVVRKPEPIDPETCKANFDRGKLTLSARKARRAAGRPSEDSSGSETSSATSRDGAS
jgi:hypothetical protein